MAIVVGGTTVTGTQTLLASVLTGTASAINGSNITNISAGKVNQIVTVNSTSQTSTTASSYSDTNLALNITPSATNSKILIFVTDSIQLQHNDSQGDQGGAFRIKRTISSSNTTLVQDNNAYEGFYHSNKAVADMNRRMHINNHYVDTAHNTTSQITYTWQIASYRSAGNAKMVSVHDNNRGNITAMEILA
tara:strand:+ start:600 stop:1172 length:573 start_codon:yes stop_codon:yes gene_type:complete